MKATNVAFILVFWVAGILADPETVKGLLKKNTNSWNVPIVAKQANENNPTQVVGGYPKLELDTLARPLKSGEITFHFFLTEAPSQSAPTNEPLLRSGRMWMQVGPKIHRLKFGTLAFALQKAPGLARTNFRL